jgi:hypothetical protein
MQRFFIIAANCAWLALLLIGLPAATHLQFGDWQITSASIERRLLFWGLVIGVAGNFFAGAALAKGRKRKILCWEWTAIFAGLLLAFWGFARGDFNFIWLRQTLLWLRNHL